MRTHLAVTLAAAAGAGATSAGAAAFVTVTLIGTMTAGILPQYCLCVQHALVHLVWFYPATALVIVTPGWCDRACAVTICACMVCQVLHLAVRTWGALSHNSPSLHA